jgi:hypothetical protein
MRKKYIKWVKVVSVDAVEIVNEPVATVDTAPGVLYVITQAGTEYTIPMTRVDFVKQWDKIDVKETVSRGRSDAAKDKAKGIPTPASTGGYD